MGVKGVKQRTPEPFEMTTRLWAVVRSFRTRMSWSGSTHPEEPRGAMFPILRVPLEAEPHSHACKGEDQLDISNWRGLSIVRIQSPEDLFWPGRGF